MTIRRGWSSFTIAPEIPTEYHEELTTYGIALYQAAVYKKKRYLQIPHKNVFIIKANTREATIKVELSYVIKRGLSILRALFSGYSFFSSRLEYVRFPGGIYESGPFGNSPRYEPADIYTSDTVLYPVANYEDSTGLFDEANKFFELMRPTVPMSYTQVIYDFEENLFHTDYTQTVIEELRKGWLGTNFKVFLNNRPYVLELLFNFFTTWVTFQNGIVSDTEVRQVGGFIKFGTTDTTPSRWVRSAGILQVSYTRLFKRTLAHSQTLPFSINGTVLIDDFLYAGGFINNNEPSTSETLAVGVEDVLELLDLKNFDSTNKAYISEAYEITVSADYSPVTVDLNIPSIGVLTCTVTFGSDRRSLSISVLYEGLTISVVPAISESIVNTTNPDATSFAAGDTITYFVEGYCSAHDPDAIYGGNYIMVQDTLTYSITPHVRILYPNINTTDYYGWSPSIGQIVGTQGPPRETYRITINGLVPTSVTPVLSEDWYLFDAGGPSQYFQRYFYFPSTTDKNGSVIPVERLDEFGVGAPGGGGVTFTPGPTLLAYQWNISGQPDFFGNTITYYEEARGGMLSEPKGTDQYALHNVYLNGELYWSESFDDAAMGTTEEAITELGDVLTLPGTWRYGVTQGFYSAETDLSATHKKKETFASYSGWPARRVYPLWGPEQSGSSDPVRHGVMNWTSPVPVQLIYGVNDFAGHEPKFFRVYLVNQRFEQKGIFECIWTASYFDSFTFSTKCRFASA